jgi:hypothetical protein
MEHGKKSGCCSKLSICNLGMAIGIIWGLSVFVLAILSMLFGMGTPIVDILSSLYWGLDSSVIGALVGLFWGFVDGFIMGALVAFVYNFCHCKCPCSYCSKNRKCCG